MAALAVIGSTLIEPDMAPLTLNTGAQSESNPNTGIQGPVLNELSPITTADRAGAAIMTILVVVFVVGGAVWLVWN